MPRRLSSGRPEHWLWVKQDALDLPCPVYLSVDEEVSVCVSSLSLVTWLFQQGNYVYETRVAMEMMSMTDSILEAKKQRCGLQSARPLNPYPHSSIHSCYFTLLVSSLPEGTELPRYRAATGEVRHGVILCS